MQKGRLNLPRIRFTPAPINTDHRSYSQPYREALESAIGQAAVKRLKSDNRIISLVGQTVPHGNGSWTVDIETLAMWSLWCANEYGPEKAEEHLERFLSADRLTITHALWITGVVPDQRIDLGDGYAIQFIDQMPDSPDKERFSAAPFLLSEPSFHFPVCAITKSSEIPKIYSYNPNAPEDSPAIQDSLRTFPRLFTIALLLNAVGGVHCSPYWHASYMDFSMPPGPFRFHIQGKYGLDVLVGDFSELPNDSGNLIRSLLEGYDVLTDSEKARMSRALERLSLAKRRSQIHIENKMLDLGIALEMVLLTRNPNHEQLAVSFRVRGAWLVGSDVNRHEKHDDLKRIYNHRSEVAHSGLLCDGKSAKIKKVREAFPKYQALAEEIFQTLILRGEPDWDRLILGTGYFSSNSIG